MKTLLILLLTTSLFALSAKQVEIINSVKAISKLVKAKDGMTFEEAMCSIVLQESSARNNIVGDDGESFGALQIRVGTAKETIAKTPYLKKWFNNLLFDTKKLKSMLKNSIEFSSLIAVHYLKMQYELALRKGYSNPYFRAISRYNGGWSNTTYWSKIQERRRYLKKYRII